MLNKANTEKVKRILDKRGVYYLKSGDYIINWGDEYSIRHANGDCIKVNWGRPVQTCADQYRAMTNHHLWVHAVDLQGYGTQQFCGGKTNIISGWSEKVLDFIKLAEQGEGTLQSTIENYQW